METARYLCNLHLMTILAQVRLVSLCLISVSGLLLVSFGPYFLGYNWMNTGMGDHIHTSAGTSVLQYCYEIM